MWDRQTDPPQHAHRNQNTSPQYEHHGFFPIVSNLLLPSCLCNATVAMRILSRRRHYFLSKLRRDRTPQRNGQQQLASTTRFSRSAAVILLLCVIWMDRYQTVVGLQHSFVAITQHHKHRQRLLWRPISWAVMPRSRRHRTLFRIAASSSARPSAASTTIESGNKQDGRNSDEAVTWKDNRPHEQRVDGPRPARRMNHSFKHLYRHDQNDENHNCDDPLEYLLQETGLTREQVLEWNRSFPVLLDLSVERQLSPKMRFLKETLGISDPATIHTLSWEFSVRSYFGSRLERIVAPRHAFLVWASLPSGPELFQQPPTPLPDNGSEQSTCLFQDFMLACRNAKQFAALCDLWRRQSHGVAENVFSTRKITATDIEAFDAIFSRGIMAAVRNELVQFNNTWPIEQLPTLKASHLVKLLIQHGASPHALDHRGATLLHWACGRGHWEAAEELLPHCSLDTIVKRDGATPFHWAAAGVSSREFGIGGHVRVCENLLEQVRQQQDGWPVRDYINRLTFDGNSALMWAAWSGTLDVVKLLVRNRADTQVRNRNGCTVAHWAASGGSLEVCQYLATTGKVNFFVQNDSGNTPLSHAVAFGRTRVVEWLLSLSSNQDNDKNVDDMLAYSLAQDFVMWTDGVDDQRNKVLQLFENDDWCSGTV